MKPDFNKAYNKLVSVEGLICNNPKDKGGFTYKGISSIEHPDWPGWQIIKNNIATPLAFIRRGVGAGAGEVLNDNPQLNQLVREFYCTEYWNKILGDHLQSQIIANEVFECSVNLGVKTASGFLQRTINLLNRNTKLYPDISADGVIGTITLKALNRCTAGNGSRMIYNILNFYQAKEYITIMEHDHSQEIFIGWFKRVKVIGNK